MLQSFVFVIGVVFGSFLNVCIYRIPRNISLLHPGSHCPNCATKLTIVDLIPVLSFFLVRGKCRSCKAPISPRYVLVEVLTGVSFLSVYLIFGYSAQTLFYFILTAILIVVTFIDFEFQIIPNRLVLTGLLFAVVANVFGFNIGVLEGFLGLAAGAGTLGLVAILSLILFKKEGMGGGDIKLMGMVGLFLGWRLTLFAIFLSVLIAAFASVVLLVFRVLKQGDAIPFGPYLALGTFLSMLFGNDIMNWYFSVWLS